MALSKFLRTGAAALGALAVASVTQANAADMYSGGYKEAPAYVPPPLWTGFYFGLHMGIDWSQVDLNGHRFSDGWNYMNFPSQTLNSNGGFGGGQFGYNFQASSAFVYGIEVDLGGATMTNRMHNYGLIHDGYVDGVSFDGKNDGGFYGDVTGRLGYTWGAALIYAKGGFAWLDTNHNMNETIYWSNGGWNGYGNNNNGNTLTGWTVGGGVEWKVSPAWSIKAEYLHFDFSNNNNNCCGDGLNSFNNNNDLTVDTVKIGFNYFWNPAPPAPLK
ncbi:MAG: outer membrane protein [Rhodomicrobium sp.]